MAGLIYISFKVIDFCDSDIGDNVNVSYSCALNMSGHLQKDSQQKKKTV